MVILIIDMIKDDKMFHSKIFSSYLSDDFMILNENMSRKMKSNKNKKKRFAIKHFIINNRV